MPPSRCWMVLRLELRLYGTPGDGGAFQRGVCRPQAEADHEHTHDRKRARSKEAQAQKRRPWRRRQNVREIVCDSAVRTSHDTTLSELSSMISPLAVFAGERSFW